MEHILITWDSSRQTWTTLNPHYCICQTERVIYVLFILSHNRGNEFFTHGHFWLLKILLGIPLSDHVSVSRKQNRIKELSEKEPSSLSLSNKSIQNWHTCSARSVTIDQCAGFQSLDQRLHCLFRHGSQKNLKNAAFQPYVHFLFLNEVWARQGTHQQWPQHRLLQESISSLWLFVSEFPFFPQNFEKSHHFNFLSHNYDVTGIVFKD